MAVITPTHPVRHLYEHFAADPVVGVALGKWACDRANGWVVRNGVAKCLKTAWLAPNGRVMRKAREIALGKADREIAAFGHILSAYTTVTGGVGNAPRITLWHVETAVALCGLGEEVDREALDAALRIHAQGAAGPEIRAAMKAYDRARATQGGGAAARRAQRIVKATA